MTSYSRDKCVWKKWTCYRYWKMVNEVVAVEVIYGQPQKPFVFVVEKRNLISLN